ncbi:hypothetical protein FSP39_008158 [Pinctada imbricata]|uniref:Integrase catalytic domain-containing protein n=1 Tax=Pinctada imbricata TaxID=66713 RepID=A0AA89CD78_PINIB|nr:hypothetical protein FSP39_008158 [Pinctada imbricata]
MEQAIAISRVNIGFRYLGCVSVQHQPTAAPVHPWDWPDTPWYRLHIDFAGPFKNAMYLIVVDSHSKWPEVFIMNSTTARATIRVLRCLFARQGIPSEIVSDNGPQFVAEEFKQFMKENGIRHITSAPYHPRTNGQADRFVQTFKRTMKSADKHSENLTAFLSKYRTTPHATTNETPSMRLYGRNIRTVLDLMKPNTTEIVKRKQHIAPKHVGSEIREFTQGQEVAVHDYRQGGNKWASGIIAEQTGPLSYKIDTENGSIWRRHVDQIRSANAKIDKPEPPLIVNLPGSSSVCKESSDKSKSSQSVEKPLSPPPSVPQQVEPPSRRYPQRIRKPPNRLDV